MSARKAGVRKIVRYGLFLLAIFILQAEILPYLPVFGLVPLLLPLAAVGVGMFETSATAGIVGLFAGVFCDISFNEPTAIFTLLLTVIGAAMPILCDTIVNRGFFAYLACCAAALVICGFSQMLPVIFYTGESMLTLIRTAAAQLIYSLVFSVPVFFAARRVTKGAR